MAGELVGFAATLRTTTAQRNDKHWKKRILRYELEVGSPETEKESGEKVNSLTRSRCGVHILGLRGAPLHGQFMAMHALAYGKG